MLFNMTKRHNKKTDDFLTTLSSVHEDFCPGKIIEKIDELHNLADELEAEVRVKQEIIISEASDNMALEEKNRKLAKENADLEAANQILSNEMKKIRDNHEPGMCFHMVPPASKREPEKDEERTAFHKVPFFQGVAISSAMFTVWHIINVIFTA